MTAILVGQQAPSFSLPNQDEKLVSQASYEGKYLVLYFYPKDDTPGCTTEAVDFSHLKSEFAKAQAVVLGISKDSSASHCKFIEKHSLSIELLSDKELLIHKEYGAYGEKKNYGKVSVGVIRSTCVIAPDGTVCLYYRGIKAKGHAERVLSDLTTLQSAKSDTIGKKSPKKKI